MSDSITSEQLEAIFPDATPERRQMVCDELNISLARFGLDSRLRKAHFFAQVRQECGTELEAAQESLEYSPQALIATFGYYKLHPAEAKTDGYDRDPVTQRIRRHADQHTVANKAYGGRYGNGNVASGDGWRFRGRGCIQVTFHDNYAAISNQCRTLYPGTAVDFIADPESMAGFPGAVRSAVGFWILHALPKLADMGDAGTDVDRITRIVNQSTNSYADRRANFVIAWNAFR